MPIAQGAHVSPTVRLVRPLGRGGMGSVWVADHLALQTQVVVKFMSPELARDPAQVQRFAHEAAAASQVKSPHVVQMFDHGVTPEGVPFIVMELLEGKDLAHHIAARGRLQPAELATIVTQVCKALSKAHEKAIVHRDIKPENIFLVDGDELYVKLLDFGIAKGTGSLSSHTGTGSMMGTPYYMCPEQILGQKGVDFRADIWSLGVVVYEALTGRKPFEADTIGALAVRINNGQLPRPSDALPGLSPAIDGWFARACAHDPNARFQSAKETAHAFAAAIGSAPSLVLSAMPSAAALPVGHHSSGWGATPPPSVRPPPPAMAPPPPPPPAPSMAPPAPAFPAPSTHFASSATPPPEPVKRSRAPLVVALVVVLLALGVGGFALYSKLTEEPAPAGKVDEPTEESPKKKKPKKKDKDTPAEPEPTPATAEPTESSEPVAKKPPPTPPPSLPPAIKVTPPPVTPTATGKKSNDDDIK